MCIDGRPAGRPAGGSIIGVLPCAGPCACRPRRPTAGRTQRIGARARLVYRPPIHPKPTKHFRCLPAHCAAAPPSPPTTAPNSATPPNPHPPHPTRPHPPSPPSPPSSPRQVYGGQAAAEGRHDRQDAPEEHHHQGAHHKNGAPAGAQGGDGRGEARGGRAGGEGRGGKAARRGEGAGNRGGWCPCVCAVGGRGLPGGPSCMQPCRLGDRQALQRARRVPPLPSVEALRHRQPHPPPTCHLPRALRARPGPPPGDGR